MVNMFGRDKILHGYKVPTRSSEQNDRSYFSFQDKVHQNYSSVDVNEVPSLCTHKNCKNTGGHQCNNPGPPNMVVWHLIDCMKPFRKSSQQDDLPQRSSVSTNPSVSLQRTQLIPVLLWELLLSGTRKRQRVQFIVDNLGLQLKQIRIK